MTFISSMVGKIPWKKWSSYHGQKRVQKAVLGCNLKNDRMISVHFQGKPFKPFNQGTPFNHSIPLNILCKLTIKLGLPWWLSGKEFAYQCRRHGFNPWSKKISWRRKLQPTPVFLPGKPHGWRSLTVQACKSIDLQRVRHHLVAEQQQKLC